MNLATVVLMALAVHFGGAELDLARNVSMEWFQSSRLAGAWELQSRSDGVYTFFAGNSTVLVERLSAPDRTYSITYLCGDELDTVSVVSLVDLPQGSAVGRAGPPGTPIYVDQDSVLAAFERRDAEGAVMEAVPVNGAAGAGNAGEAPGNETDAGAVDDPREGAAGRPSGPGDSEAPAGPALGRYEITRGRGLITLIDAVSAQVLTVRF
ncbi:MAG: hypothetical protein PF508_14670 [Spirochaeta sp.]|jgi:hypothetical protein|nr:hypothetical protein [Spirochaeta sp.]